MRQIRTIHGETNGTRSLAVMALAIALSLLIGAVVVGMVIPQPVAAASTTTTSTPPDYYNDSVNVNNESWMEGNENATLDSTIGFVTRIGTFIVGSGGGASAVGSILTSVVLGGVVLGLLGGATVGIVGGVTVGTLTLGALAAAGMVPVWLWALGVLAVGVVLATIVIRALK